LGCFHIAPYSCCAEYRLFLLENLKKHPKNDELHSALFFHIPDHDEDNHTGFARRFAAASSRLNKTKNAPKPQKRYRFQAVLSVFIVSAVSAPADAAVSFRARYPVSFCAEKKMGASRPPGPQFRVFA